MRHLFRATWVDDAGIEAVIRSVQREHGLVLDPHSATAWAAASEHRRADVPMVAVATAHPAKFADAVTAATGIVPGLPDDLADLATRPERTHRVAASVDDVARFIRSEFG
jgi:threonine synthase